MGRAQSAADTALRLGKYFDTGAEFWSNLQSNYELCRAAAHAKKDLEAIPQLTLG
jgi:plasmid maintenance system antidote protein VapI